MIWDALGEVHNFVEPFFGSGAVLLGRPHEPRIETVNDLDAYLANFWRAITIAPDDVAKHADWPVNEADLHARHHWLVDQAAFRERMKTEPEFFDARIAGWWVWGLSAWIGGGWCAVKEHVDAKHPSVAGNSAGRGIHRKIPNVDWRGSKGVHQRRPNMGGQGGGQGVQSPTVVREPNGLVAWFRELAARLRRVRVCCGDWKRVLTPAVITSHGGVTGVVLDPPYDLAERAAGCYAEDGAGVSAEVRAWALEHGDAPMLRIVLCGYEGEHEMPATWRVVEWATSGGYARNERGKENKTRERLWLSPACLQKQRGLFA